MKQVYILCFVISAMLFLPGSASTQQTIRFDTDPKQEVNVPYRLFKTENMWNMLLLDTRDGRVWQIQYSVEENASRAKVPINDIPLVSGSECKVGRFTLYRTENMWTFLLLDQYDGRVWQCQFSVSGDNRFIIPILSEEELLEELLDPNTSDSRKAQILEKLKPEKTLGTDGLNKPDAGDGK